VNSRKARAKTITKNSAEKRPTPENLGENHGELSHSRNAGENFRNSGENVFQNLGENVFKK
jgi:hypothetical protein